MADVDHSEADKEELPDFLQNQYHTKKFEKYSPEYKFMSSRLFFNAFIFIAAVSAAVLVDTMRENQIATLASASHTFDYRFWAVGCNVSHASPGAPTRCGRVVWDELVPEEHVSSLLAMGKALMSYSPGGSGGPTILDLHTGALSYKDAFINVYKKLEQEERNETEVKLHDDGLASYKIVRELIETKVNHEFGASGLKLTQPTFFSRITNKSAVTSHDEYWHRHVDKQTYGTFDVTCLLYLATFEQDFEGGEFLFFTPNMLGIEVQQVVEPRFGRFSCFTSGYENPHRVKEVTSGTRYALTLGFTSNKKAVIPNPSVSHAVAESVSGAKEDKAQEDGHA